MLGSGECEALWAAADLVCDREHYGFNQLLYLLIEASDVAVVLCGLLIHLHGLHPGVILCWQGIQDQVGILQTVGSPSAYSMGQHLVHM